MYELTARLEIQKQIRKLEQRNEEIKRELGENEELIRLLYQSIEQEESGIEVEPKMSGRD